ncbi:NAD-dependent epimerase/dehydratase family protein [Amycolatopsis lurida]
MGRQLITVLGSSGLLGTAITRELAERPVRLRLAGRRGTAVPPDARADTDVRTIDLLGHGAVASAIAGADVVVHLVAHIGGARTWRMASTTPLAERVNLGLLRDLIAAVRAQRRRRPPVVLLAGSMSQVGRTSGRIDGSEPDRPLTTYDRQKLDAEHALVRADADGLVQGSTLRLATLYSRGTDAAALDRGVVSVMMRRAFAGQPLTMWHDGSVERDLLCVDDAARAFVAALDEIGSIAHRSWLVGSGQGTSIADLFTAIANAVAARTGGQPVPVAPVRPLERLMPTDLLDFVLDPSAFRKATGWRARVPLLEGLDGLADAIAADRAAGRDRRETEPCES